MASGLSSDQRQPEAEMRKCELATPPQADGVNDD